MDNNSCFWLSFDMKTCTNNLTLNFKTKGIRWCTGHEKRSCPVHEAPSTAGSGEGRCMQSYLLMRRECFRTDLEREQKRTQHLEALNKSIFYWSTETNPFSEPQAKFLSTVSQLDKEEKVFSRPKIQRTPSCAQNWPIFSFLLKLIHYFSVVFISNF